MKKLKRKILNEEEYKQEIYTEPTTDELLAQLENNEITLDDIEVLHNNGQISDETFNEIEQILTNPESQPQEEVDPVQVIVDKINNGEATLDDLDIALQNGEIDQKTYDDVLNLINAQPQEEEMMEEPELVPNPAVNNFNLVHLYDQFISLKKSFKIYIDAFADIDLDQITDRQYKITSNIFNDIRDTLEKLNFYLINEFKINDYNKNLYVYLLYNKQFSENIIKLRRVLQLNAETNETIEKLKEKEENK